MDPVGKEIEVCLSKHGGEMSSNVQRLDIWSVFCFPAFMGAVKMWPTDMDVCSVSKSANFFQV